jgi:hypothetical protein
MVQSSGSQPLSDRGPVIYFFYKTRVRYNWCHGPVPGRGPSVEKHWYIGGLCPNRELCWRQRKLLVVPPMPERSKGRGQTNCSLWSSGLGVGRGANDPTPARFTVRNHGGGQNPHKVVAPVNKKTCMCTRTPKTCSSVNIFIFLQLKYVFWGNKNKKYTTLPTGLNLWGRQTIFCLQIL